jgi:hypothetical protein
MAKSKNLYQRFRKLNTWSKLAVIASICTILSFSIFILVPQAHKQNIQQISVHSDTSNITVLQSGHDIIVNSPIYSTEKSMQTRKETSHERTTRIHADSAIKQLTQTMMNSPGSIQAGGNVTISADRRLISTLQLFINVQTLTATAQKSDVETDAGLGSIVALFTKDKARIRFASDFMITDQQITPTIRRLGFRYTPEIPQEILGKPVDFLADIEVLVVNYANIFQMEKFNTNNDSTSLTCIVFLNGVDVAELIADVHPPGTLSKGQAVMNVTREFSGIPTRYAKAVGR